jgi:hypothetical protein
MARENLCTACRFADICVYATSEGDEVRHCAGFQPVDSGSDGSVPASETSALGLCVSCCLRLECERERPAGGIWHCEDYC